MNPTIEEIVQKRYLAILNSYRRILPKEPYQPQSLEHICELYVLKNCTIPTGALEIIRMIKVLSDRPKVKSDEDPEFAE